MFFDLHVALHAVDQNVLAVGVDPGLGYLGRPVGHRGRDVARVRLAQQGKLVFGELHTTLPINESTQ
jgi:hypothetical protein